MGSCNSALVVGGGESLGVGRVDLEVQNHGKSGTHGSHGSVVVYLLRSVNPVVVDLLCSRR